MQSESNKPLLNTNLKAILAVSITVVVISLFLFKNLFFQSTFLLKKFGELSVDPQIAFKNNKPTFLEFYAEWCEVCKEMAPKISTLKEEYEEDINFVFLNVDNQKWDNYDNINQSYRVVSGIQIKENNNNKVNPRTHVWLLPT